MVTMMTMKTMKMVGRRRRISMIVILSTLMDTISINDRYLFHHEQFVVMTIIIGWIY